MVFVLNPFLLIQILLGESVEVELNLTYVHV